MIEIVSAPGRWPKVTLGELCDIRGGFPAPQEDAAFEHGAIPFVRMKDVGRHHLTNNLFETEQSLSRTEFEQGRYQLTPRGSILMPRSGSVGLNHRAVLTVDAVIVSHLCALVPTSDKVTTDFLYRFLCLADMRKLTKKTTGLDSIAFSDLHMVAVPLPPLAEQRRIAEVLDRAEGLRAKRRAALTQLDSLTQSLFLDLFGDPARNTKNLPLIRLGDIGDWQSGGTPPRARADYFEGHVPWFSSGELESVVVRQSHEHISELALRETSAKPVPQGALMLGMYDTAALKASFAGVDCSCNQAIAFAALDESIVTPAFVFHSIVIGREHFRRLQRGVRQKNLNLSMIRDIRIPHPPLPVQQAFAGRVAVVEKLKAAQRAALAELDSLFASLQHRAFRGEL